MSAARPICGEPHSRTTAQHPRGTAPGVSDGAATAPQPGGSSRHTAQLLFSSSTSTTDVDGLRCEVRSMRSVPHALYALPSISHVVTAYVRQLMDDFTSSLLLCRPTRQQQRFLSPALNARDSKENEMEDEVGEDASTVTQGRDVGAAASWVSIEDEETYLLLRLCVLEAQRRRRCRVQQQRQSNNNEGIDVSCSIAPIRLTAENDSVRDSEDMSTVEDQLLELFAAAEDSRRGYNKDSIVNDKKLSNNKVTQLNNFHIGEGNFPALFSLPAPPFLQQQQQQVDGNSRTDATPLAPPLLSSLLRFKPLLRDMQFLSRHLLLPRHTWPHHQREWVSVYEDVGVTLRDRLARYRPSVTASTDSSDIDDDNNSKSVKRESRTRRIMPANKIEQLWYTLWELLGAAWRQRDRLWGAYRYLQGPRQLPPLSLNSQAAQAVPPGVHSSPILRDHYTRHLIHTSSANPHPQYLSSGPRGVAALPVSLVAAHDEDGCAFGPFTSSDIGVSAERLYVLREPLAAALRLLRVCVPASGRDALVTSTTAFAGFTYVKEPSPRPSASSTFAGAGGVAVANTTSSPQVVVPLFDVTDEDMRLRAAVPYLSPEVYLTQQYEQRSRLPPGGTMNAPIHRFSDDMWNAAVVVLEAALSGFAVFDAAQCHLACIEEATATVVGEVVRTNNLEDSSSPDAVPPPQSSSSSSLQLLLPTDCVYTDALVVLTQQHHLSHATAHNFLYAALYHLHAQMKRLAMSNGEEASGSDAELQDKQKSSGFITEPSPARLACEWVAYLRAHYEFAFIKDILAGEVVAKGLCWRRSERWNAFGMAHITTTATNTATTDAAMLSPHGAASRLNSNMTAISGAENNSKRGIFLPGTIATNTIDTSPTMAHPQTEMSYAAGSRGSMSMLSDNMPDTNDAPSGAEQNLDGTAPVFLSTGIRTSPQSEDSASPKEVPSSKQQQSQHAHPTLAGALSTRLDSLASFDVFSHNTSAAQSPLRGGNASFSSSTASIINTSAAATAVLARLPQKLDRTVNALDTPLMPLFRLPRTFSGSSAENTATLKSLAHDSKQSQRELENSSTDALWDHLKRYLRYRTRPAGSSSSTRNANNNNMNSSVHGRGGGSGRANGAVADAADVDCVEELFYLLFTCVQMTLCDEAGPHRCHDHRGSDSRGSSYTKNKQAGQGKQEEDRASYVAVNHPFFRGAAERGLLSTYITLCGCAVNDNDRREDTHGQRRDYFRVPNAKNKLHAQGSALPSLNLYVPTRVLLATLARLEKRDATTNVYSRMNLNDVKDTVAAASNIMAVLEQKRKQAGALRTLIGDDVRAWEAARDASRRAGNGRSRVGADYGSYLPTYAPQLSPQPAPVHRARPAVDAVLSALEVSVLAQLHHIARLRRLLYESNVSDASGGGEAERAIRLYLRSHFIPVKGDKFRQTVSPFFTIPPTIRGVVWGCLLRVPSSRKREATYLHSVHRTAAKPSLNDRQLFVDIPRCHAYHPLLASARGSAQLQRLLKAWLFAHPRYAYWQGLDSVCAVLLTVSPHDEALVFAQLNALVERFIAHDEDNEDGLGSRSSFLQHSPLQPSLSVLPQKPSMADQLHRLVVMLRYCDPLLAHYLFNVLGCTPELYAISWLLTLFSHSLPTKKVYCLWDLLFVYDDVGGMSGSGSAACLVALCAAVMVHRRTVLLSSSFSGCLSVFSSGASQLDVAAAVGDTRQLMSVLPPSVLSQPLSDDMSMSGGGGGRRLSALNNGRQSSPNPTQSHGTGDASRATGASTLACLSVDDLKAAWAVAKTRTTETTMMSPTSSDHNSTFTKEQRQQQHWSDSGIYLVDIRPSNNTPRGGSQDSLLGAIRLPLSAAGSPTSSPSTPPEVSDQDRVNGNRYDRLQNHRETKTEFQQQTTMDAGEGWGIVEEQERLQEAQQQAREAQERHVADAAAEIVRLLSNSFVPAMVPRANSMETADGAAPPWPVHPIVLKTSISPHVVIIASGGGTDSTTATVEDEEEMALAHQLGIQLSACGVHNVSVLRGGMAAIRRSLPELVVPHVQES